MMTLARNSLVNRAVNPLLARLPIEHFRPEQVRAILEILAAFEDSDVVVLDAPTGSGKTVVAESVRLLGGWRGLYLCHSKGLQDQFANDFDYGRVVKGRANYRTGRFWKQFPRVSCDDCQWTQDDPTCQLCESKQQCPYEVAKVRALKGELAVLNTSYALTEWNGPGRFSGREFVVVDEADTFESVVQSFISVAVSRRRMAAYGWEPPKVTVVADWVRWLDEKIPELERRASGEEDGKERKRLERLVAQMGKVRNGVCAGVPYAFTGRSGGAEFKPVLVSDFCQEALWKHGTQFLLMSATVVSSSAMLRGLGYSGSHHTVRMESSFPARNRPVVVKPVTNMSRKGQDDRLERMARAVCDEVEGERGRVLVHTVSYDLATAISGVLRSCTRRPVATYRMASERAAALAEYARVSACVLVACSADRGVDLPDDLCRLIVIAKVPYPNLGDRMVAARLYGTGVEGRQWYQVQTVRNVVQMAGRGMRHKDDYCRTVVLDSQFGELWKAAGWLFPKWFREAVVWENGSR